MCRGAGWCPFVDPSALPFGATSSVEEIGSSVVSLQACLTGLTRFRCARRLFLGAAFRARQDVRGQKFEWLGAWSGVVKLWQGSDVKWKVVCSSERSQLCARSSPLRWRRLSRFGAPHHRRRWRELVLGRPPALANERAPSHRGPQLPRGLCRARPCWTPREGQPPRAAAPFLSVDFPRFGWRRHEGSAPADF